MTILLTSLFLVAIAEKFNLPIHYIGVGESADDLASFAERQRLVGKPRYDEFEKKYS